MISFKDYEDENGKVDWTAYYKAQTDSGERCRLCREHIIFPKGYATTCQNCLDLIGSSDEKEHERMIRCPHCVHVFSPEEYAMDEEMVVVCPQCDEEFVVTVRVTYHFTSPKVVWEGEE
tara:strand:+ start:3569 stop:3925 length:357 start_codon:yes stop_codon:yes gene_type:complete